MSNSSEETAAEQATLNAEATMTQASRYDYESQEAGESEKHHR